MSKGPTIAVDTAHIASVAKPFRLQFEEAQDNWVLLYPEGMVKLNGPAGEILKRCDGVKDIDTVINELEAAFEQKGLKNDVIGFFEVALEKRWVKLEPAA